MEAQPGLTAAHYHSLANLVVEHTRWRSAYALAETLVMLGKHQGEAPILRISGPPGVGKSTIRETLNDAYKPVTDACRVEFPRHPVYRADSLPLLSMVIPPGANRLKIYQAFACAMGDPDYMSKNEIALFHRITLLGGARSLQGVVLDDVHRLAELSGTVVGNSIMEALVTFHAALKVPFIFLGLGSMRFLFNQLRGQARRRSTQECRLLPFKWSYGKGGGDCDEFVGVLLDLCEGAKLPLSIDLTDQATVYRLYYASLGTLNGLKKLLLFAIVVSLSGLSPSKVIDMDLLELAFIELLNKEYRDPKTDYRLGEMENPFLPGFDFRQPPEFEDDRLEQMPAEDRRKQKQREIGPEKGALRQALTR